MSVQTTSPVIEAREIVVRFRARHGIAAPGGQRNVVRAVDGVSLSIERGEFVALVGESGAGKTTFGLAVLALEKLHSGAILLCGEDVLRARHRRVRELRRHAQIVFQDPYESLDPRFRVERLIEEPLIIHRIGSKTERKEKVVHALERVDLVPAELFLRRFPHELSGGQRQRVAIASALVLEPDLLVADEPVSMLDVSVRAGILDLLDRLRADGLSILMITHDLATAATYADRIAVMYLGRIVEQGPAQQLVTHPSHPYTRALLSVVPRADPNAASETIILQGEIPDPTAIPSGCRFHPRCPVALPTCSEHDPEPADVTGDHWAACVLVGARELPPSPASDPDA